MWYSSIYLVYSYDNDVVVSENLNDIRDIKWEKKESKL